MTRPDARAAVAVCLLALAGGGAQAAEDCLGAASLEAAGQLPEALEKYRERLAEGDAPACAAKGIADVRAAIGATSLSRSLALARAGNDEAATELFKHALQNGNPSPAQLAAYRTSLSELTLERGRALQLAGDREAAVRAFSRVIATAPQSEAAAEASRGLRLAALRTIREQVANGRFSEARQQLHSLQSLDATLGETGDSSAAGPTIPKDLLFLNSEADILFWELRHNFAQWRPWFIYGALLIVALVVLRQVTRRLRRPLLEIEDFDSGGLEKAVSGGFPAMVRSRLERLGHSAQPGDRIRMVTAPIEPVDIPAEVRSVVPSRFAWVGVLPWIWSALFPRRILRLSGYLHPSGPRGPGVTLQLAADRRVVTTQTLWQRDFLGGRPVDEEAERVASFYRLADYGSVWLAFHLGGSSFSYLGTRSWYALALSRAAYHQADIDGYPAAAKALYIEALAVDREFHSARLNLAMLSRDSEKAFGIKLLEQVTQGLTAGGGEVRFDDPAVYAAQYTRSVWLYDLSAKAEEDGDGKEQKRLLEKAEHEARELLALIVRVLQGDRHKLLGFLPSIGSSRERLHDYLNRIRHLVEVLLAGLLAANGKCTEAVEMISVRPADTSEDAGQRLPALPPEPPMLALETTPSSGVQYNLACTCAIIAGAFVVEKRGPWLRKSLTLLSRAFWFGGSTRHVKEDPSLRTLSDDPTWGPKFRKLVDDYNLPKAIARRELSLSEAIIIGDAHAKALADERIDSSDELVHRSRTAPEREELADSLQIDAAVLVQWAHYADLLRLTGLTIVQANLLYLTGVRSVEDLAGCDAGRLYASAAAMAKARGTEVAPKERYFLWVEEASALPKLIH